MATIIDTPTIGNNEENEITMALGLILFVVVLFLFFAYGLPWVRGSTSSPQINIPASVEIR